MAMSAAASTWLIPCMARTHGEQLKLHNKYSSSSSSRHSRIRCNCKASSWMTSELDLYDLLGIDNTSGQSEVKTAYRSLQKRCHPDIAGPAGHDMSIILNQAYAILSDPNARLSYDREQAKISEFKGFTGRPLYSVWRGSQTEQRAIFVDEIKCVGCLKCALLANNTFAIESVYGRARVVAQWADSHHKIQDAIDSCPVNCISDGEEERSGILPESPGGQGKVSSQDWWHQGDYLSSSSSPLEHGDSFSAHCDFFFNFISAAPLRPTSS
ncbi:chaperone protein dnaJ C76, chloroplastic-like [Arachis stenosperma]|uniref:chaperone protein dnaJ C76, chloroplastic-like n=1 Tax=Arachis stenosperma TaxID=217475 RepID=UPI0025ABA9CE|nr:chaperone protein dnaJ C76, chloroplastic-like [Arachis stenosperma]